MIKKTNELEPGDVLPFTEGRAEVMEVFQLPSGGAGILSGMWKITSKVLDVYEGDKLIVGKNYITFTTAGHKWRVEGLEEIEA